MSANVNWLRLLRDGLYLAGIAFARCEYRAALSGFRQARSDFRCFICSAFDEGRTFEKLSERSLDRLVVLAVTVVHAAPLTDWRSAYEATPLRSSEPAGQRTRVLIVLPSAPPVTNA